jgi:hypothetical protein
MASIIINPNDLVQSKYTYLGAAGSTGADGSTPGVHLRWDFAGNLGLNHLPKGNLAQSAPYATTVGFNKPNDFVSIYRVPYVNKHPATVNFSTHVPDRLVESGPTRSWEFDIVIPTITSSVVITTIQLRFTDIAEYTTIRSGVDPNVDPAQFLSQYTDIIEVEALGKLSFSVSLTMKYTGTPPQPGRVRMESVSEGDASNVVTCRQKFPVEDRPVPGATIPIVDQTAILQGDSKGEIKIMAENITYVRFDYTDSFPVEIRVETYYDFITGTSEHATMSWEPMGDFSLSLTDSDVHNRLDNVNFNVDRNWPRFNDSDQVTGAATVNVDNYKEKWLPATITANDYLKKGVEEYLLLSTAASNLPANKILPADPDPNNPNPNQAQMSVSMLELLQLVSLDYHIARMLGLGHIDADPAIGTVQYMYLMEYTTLAALEGGLPQTIGHHYMTLPTGKSDQRLPSPPILKDIEYGLFVPGLPDPIELTLPGGYAPYEPIRFIRLFREADPVVINQFLSFFNVDNEFCLGATGNTVFHGIEYRHSSASNWVMPEISFDELFTDAAGNFEALPIMAEADITKPLYIHQETTPGQHKYALYGINWFSRASAVGNIKETDATVFPDFCPMIPPSNFAVHLIQKETPLMFTTAAEQAKLAAISGSADDNEILVRTTFEWNHIHNIAYQKADVFEFYFREEPPGVVRGQILSKIDLPNNRVEVTVGSYVTVSTGDTVTPVVTPGTESRYEASVFSVDGESYYVESASNSGGLKFILIKNSETHPFEFPINSGSFMTTQVFNAPNVGDIFMVVENLSSPNSWVGKKLVKTIECINFTSLLDENGNTLGSPALYTETTVEADNSLTVRNIGGIFESASITEVLDVGPDINGDPMNIPGSKTGIFTIEFDSFILADHPDAEVEWYKGTVRIDASISGVKKNLTVWDIGVTTGGTLKLLAFDPTFSVVGGGDYTPNNDYEPIVQGTGVLINFHPGYRAYFFAETNFDQAEILPAQGQNVKNTYMTVRSYDTVKPCESYITTPVILQAREIVPPMPPAEPTGPLFATRPGYDGRSTYTFDTEVNTNNREPFSLVFYRSSEQTILEQLYLPGTIDLIRNDLANLPPDEAIFMADRWKGLVNVDLETAGPDIGKFKAYHTTVGMGVYRFPNPDNTAYYIPNADNAAPRVYPFPMPLTPVIDRVELFTQAIDGAFLPLTEEPVIYSNIDFGYQTSNRKVVIRNSNGDRISSSHPEYDPNPMVVVYPDRSTVAPTHTVRFSDYTLDGASLNIFFYYAKEMANNLQFGPRGPIGGPVRLVNSLPPAQPQIVKVVSRTANPIDEIRPGVIFTINEYLTSDQVNKFQIYRAYNAADALSLRTMKPVRSTPYLLGDTLIDDFSEDEFIPYGETFFYRIVAIREILNEQDQPENIPSYPSDLILASIVDVTNPPSPELSFVSEGLTELTPKIIQNVKLRWKKTAHNAVYSLYKMSPQGNWDLLTQTDTNDSVMFYNAGDLPKEDGDGEPLYHRYRVHVVNSSGLPSIDQKELTI